MRFKEILSVLSKSSPYAVSTERAQAISEQLDAVKQYLYIPTIIEQDFKRALDEASSTARKVIFLCGSSGDGKSEILTRYSKEYADAATFHLDATHSFDPNTTAIQTLDGLFDESQSSQRSLVVGINIGMLGNYAQEGNNEHIKKAIKTFLDGGRVYDNVLFLNFEDYAKFQLNEAGHTSEFIQSVFDKITAKENNPIRECFDLEMSHANTEKKLCANYRLLSIPQVQERIIEILFKTRLMKDQFLTARTLLDFLHSILVGPGTSTGYLFDNLFEESDNELSASLVAFDPADVRTNAIDKFVLSYSLGIKDELFEEYITYLSTEIGVRKPNKPRPNSYLRLFYLLKDAEISNQYHTQFMNDFAENLIERYSQIWNLHQNYTGEKEERNTLRAFYRDTVITAVHKYNNRNATSLNKGQFLTSQHNGYQIVAEVALKPNLDAVSGDATATPAYFLAQLKLENEPFQIPINVNLLKLMEDIVNGYRPNKHDKNTVVLLDELVDRISDIAVNAEELMIIKKDKKFTVKNIDDEDIEVSGI